MESIVAILGVANSLSPLAVIALLCYIVFILVRREQAVPEAKAISAQLTQLKTNDLHELPEMAQTLRDMHVVLVALDSYLRAKLNGHDLSR